MSDVGEDEYNPEDVARELLVTFSNAIGDRVDEFRAEAKRSEERAEQLRLRSMEQVERAREYERHASLLAGFKDAGHKFVAEMTRSREAEPSDRPYLSRTELAQMQDNNRAMPDYGK